MLAAVLRWRRVNKLLLAPGFACGPEIWAGAGKYLVEAELIHARWEPGMLTVEAARAYLADLVRSTSPDVYVGHSLGGLLLLELLAAERIPSRPTIVVDAFLADPADLFKNFVWEDHALRARVTASLDAHRPQFGSLRASIASWRRTGWPQAALDTGAHFVYGGRGASDAEVVEALGWPRGAATRERLTIIPRTSHFLMLEAPERFYAVVARLMA